MDNKATHQPPPQSSPQTDSQPAADSSPNEPGDAGGASQETEPVTAMPKGFRLAGDGLEFTPGGDKEPFILCGKLEVPAATVDRRGGFWIAA